MAEQLETIDRLSVGLDYLYVALTRAKDELILVRSPEYIAQWGANNCFFDTLPAPLVVLAEHGQRRRELWLGKSSLDAVIPPLEE
jgi:hypothetical protein